MATAGKIALRNLNGAYAFSCWIAWPDLVRGDRDGRDRMPVVDALGEIDGALPRVVVVGERPARRRIDGDAREPVVVEDRARDLLARHPVRNRHLHLRRDGRLQPVLDPEADDERRDQEEEVEPEATHVPRIVPTRPAERLPAGSRRR